MSGRARADIALVAVVGDVDLKLFDAFLEHYEALGVNELALGFVCGRACKTLIRRCEARACRPYIVHPGPWRVSASTWMRDELRRKARCDWHVLADVDEFQAYPGGLRGAIDECESHHRPCAAGLLLDRLELPSSVHTTPQTRTGSTAHFHKERSLRRAYWARTQGRSRLPDATYPSRSVVIILATTAFLPEQRRTLFIISSGGRAFVSSSNAVLRISPAALAGMSARSMPRRGEPSRSCRGSSWRGRQSLITSLPRFTTGHRIGRNVPQTY